MSKTYLDLTPEERKKYIEVENCNSWDDVQEVCCPFCNEQQGLDWEDVSYEEDASTCYNCGDCGKAFNIHTRVTHTFTTELDEEDIWEELNKKGK